MKYGDVFSAAIFCSFITGCFSLVSIALALLKLAGILTCSWLMVLSPVIITIGVLFIVVAVVTICNYIEMKKENNCK